MEKKVKLVYVCRTELNQRVVDFFCLDELSKDFDLEYWDCTDFIYLPQCFENKMDRPYLRKIHSIGDFRDNLNRIPKDTIVTFSFNLCEKNRKILKALSKRFPTIVHVSFYANTPHSINLDAAAPAASSAWKRFVSFVKKPLYNSLIVKTLVKILFHPRQYRVWVNHWQWQKEISRFKEIVWFSCARNTRYHINHPDVEQYVRLRNEPPRRNDRYIVYIDQYIPYHVDLKFHKPDLNTSQVAKEFFSSMNRYFAFLEEKYACKVVVAVHPMANYSDNPYEGREMCLFQTAALVRDSIGVCMHSSNSLSFVILFDKPVVSLVNNAIREIPRLDNQVLNMTNEWHIPLVDTDKSPFEGQPLQKVDTNCRQAYIEKYFGDFETEGLRDNAELLKEHYLSVYYSLWRNQTTTEE